MIENGQQYIAERVAIDECTGCWNWTGRTNFGYGIGVVDRQNYRAHRLSYESFVGPIPAELVIDHLCRNRKCCNPKHLEPVTPRENMMRGVNIASIRAKQTHCIHGHEFTPETTYIATKQGGFRQCKICKRAREKVARAAAQIKSTTPQQPEDKR